MPSAFQRHEKRTRSTSKAEPALSMGHRRHGCGLRASRHAHGLFGTSSRSSTLHFDACQICSLELTNQALSQRGCAIFPQVIVEIAEAGLEDRNRDTCVPGPHTQLFRRTPPYVVKIPRDVELSHPFGQVDGAEVCRRERCPDRKTRQSLAERQHGFEPFTDHKTLAWGVDLYGIAKQLPHGPTLDFHRCLARAILREPCTMYAPKTPCPVGHRSDKGGARLGRGLVVISMPTARMKAQRRR